MSRTFQNRLLQHDEAPPASVWDKIALRLDEEFNTNDIRVSSRLEDVSATPPQASWEIIASTLDSSTKIHEPVPLPTQGRVIPLIYRRVAVAVLLAGAVTLGALYLLRNENQQTTSDGPADEIVQHKADLSIPEPSKTPEPLSSNPAAQLKKVVAARKRTEQPENKQPERISYRPPGNQVLAVNDIEQAHLSAVHTVSHLQPVSVSAPPIRDEQGNIIMDLDVISNPGEPYIVVTGPNGDQTKISNKFLHCLSYINGDYSNAEMNTEGRQWKMRFQQWRNELLREAAFVPAANNFFDIFELKELIQDR